MWRYFTVDHLSHIHNLFSGYDGWGKGWDGCLVWDIGVWRCNWIQSRPMQLKRCPFNSYNMMYSGTIAHSHIQKSTCYHFSRQQSEKKQWYPQDRRCIYVQHVHSHVGVERFSVSFAIGDVGQPPQEEMPHSFVQSTKKGQLSHGKKTCRSIHVSMNQPSHGNCSKYYLMCMKRGLSVTAFLWWSRGGPKSSVIILIHV